MSTAIPSNALSIRRLPESLRSEELSRSLAALHGSRADVLERQRNRILRLSRLFAAEFPDHAAVRLFSTPGRTEVGGNHTDHQRGHVLCAAVGLDMIALVAQNDDRVIRLKSEGYEKMDRIDLASLDPVPAERNTSAALIRGVAAGLSARGVPVGGFDAYTTSLVPKGSGLSSSAAFEVLVATILDTLYGEGRCPPLERAKVGQFAENEYFGKPSGLMDQCGCSLGGFIAIDFRNPAAPVVEPVHFNLETVAHSLVITNTGGSHADLTDAYASIPADMRAVAAMLGGRVLTDLTEEDLWARLPELRGALGDRAVLRALHFYADDRRVTAQTEALHKAARGDLAAFQRFLDLVRESGLSSWTLLQNVYHAPTAESEQPIAIGLAASARVLGGRGACRVHGGGFAGTIQAFVPDDLLQAYLTTMESLFGEHAAHPMRIRSLGSVEVVPGLHAD